MFSNLSSRVSAAAERFPSREDVGRAVSTSAAASAAASVAAHGAKLAAGAAGRVEEYRLDATKREAEAARQEAAVKVPEFREALAALHAANVDAFLGGDKQELYPRPGAAEAEAGAAATARRLAPLALEAVKTAGYGKVYLAYKVAKGGISAMVLTPQFRTLAEHVVPLLNDHSSTIDPVLDNHRRGARETELALRLYYLGCTEAMAKLSRMDYSRAGEKTAPSEGNLEATDAVLASLGDWLGPAQWLYAAYELPAPHDTADWGAWYAAQLAQRHRWTTVACVGAGSSDVPCVPTAPRSTPFPAWQLAARETKLADGEVSRHAVLCIRGSSSQHDWFINAHTTPEGLEIGGVQYMAHGGLLRAARAILDDCGCRAALDRRGCTAQGLACFALQVCSDLLRSSSLETNACRAQASWRGIHADRRGPLTRRRCWSARERSAPRR